MQLGREKKVRATPHQGRYGILDVIDDALKESSVLREKIHRILEFIDVKPEGNGRRMVVNQYFEDRYFKKIAMGNDDLLELRRLRDFLEEFPLDNESSLEFRRLRTQFRLKSEVKKIENKYPMLERYKGQVLVFTSMSAFLFLGSFIAGTTLFTSTTAAYIVQFVFGICTAEGAIAYLALKLKERVLRDAKTDEETRNF